MGPVGYSQCSWISVYAIGYHTIEHCGVCWNLITRQ